MRVITKCSQFDRYFGDCDASLFLFLMNSQKPMCPRKICQYRYQLATWHVEQPSGIDAVAVVRIEGLDTIRLHVCRTNGLHEYPLRGIV